jgi:hypothetical protein
MAGKNKRDEKTGERSRIIFHHEDSTARRESFLRAFAAGVALSVNGCLYLTTSLHQHFLVSEILD